MERKDLIENISVSVCCITYNHEKFIRKTLDGFLSQKTSFAFEVLIHDDASTDKTQEIITEYAEKYPEIIKPILQKENHRSKGISVQRTYNYPRTKGKYVAFCDGDDYWTDPMKLQMQFDILEKYTDCALCVHNTRCIEENGAEMEAWIPGIILPEGKLEAEKYIHMQIGEGRYLFQTGSYFVRKEIVDDFLNYHHEYPCGDIPLVLFALQYGHCWYIPQEMSYYRKHAASVMTITDEVLDSKIRFSQRMIAGHKKFDEYTKGKYKEDFDLGIKKCEVKILKLQGSYRNILAKKYRKILMAQRWKTKLLIYLGAVFPKIVFRLFCIYKKLK